MIHKPPSWSSLKPTRPAPPASVLLTVNELGNPLLSPSPLKSWSKIASYFLGVYYDYELSISDSAKYYYQYVSENFPSSAQAESANKRLEVLNAQ